MKVAHHVQLETQSNVIFFQKTHAIKAKAAYNQIIKNELISFENSISIQKHKL